MDRASVLAQNLASLAEARRKNRRKRALSTDRTLRLLVTSLVVARTGACMTQEEVAARMGTTKSAVSRLESGVHTRPTLRGDTRANGPLTRLRSTTHAVDQRQTRRQQREVRVSAYPCSTRSRRYKCERPQTGRSHCDSRGPEAGPLRRQPPLRRCCIFSRNCCMRVSRCCIAFFTTAF